jgi:hypothetical protein
MPIIPLLGRLRQEDYEFETTWAIYIKFQTSLGYIVRYSLKKKKISGINLSVITLNENGLSTLVKRQR